MKRCGICGRKLGDRLADYANDRAGMEQTLDGDFDRSMGKRLETQAARIAGMVA